MSEQKQKHNKSAAIVAALLIAAAAAVAGKGKRMSRAGDLDSELENERQGFFCFVLQFATRTLATTLTLNYDVERIVTSESPKANIHNREREKEKNREGNNKSHTQQNFRMTLVGMRCIAKTMPTSNPRLSLSHDQPYESNKSHTNCKLNCAVYSSAAKINTHSRSLHLHKNPKKSKNK